LGSVEMWRNYFGSTARIYGIDIDPIAGRHKDVATKVFIGNQLDRDFLQSALQEVDHPAGVIGGGGHTANPQITAFEELDPTLRETWRLRYDHVAWAVYGPDQLSFLQFAFMRYTQLREWTGKAENFEMLGTDQNESLANSVSEFCQTTKANSFFDSMIERNRRHVWR